MPTTVAYPENQIYPSGPVIGRRLSFGSVSKAGTRFTAMMRKPDIAARAAEPDSLSKAEAERAVNVLLKAIRGALASGNTVSLAGFGALRTDPAGRSVSRLRRLTLAAGPYGDAGGDAR